MKTIAISGKMLAGKTTLAKKLETLYESKGLNVRRIGFASSLKEEIYAQGFPFTDMFESKPKYMRELLQAYGAAKRANWPDYWVKKLMARLDILDAPTMFFPIDVVIIDDMRYKNEFEVLQKRAAILIRLTRTGNWRQDMVPGYDHESETALDYMAARDYDYYYSVESGNLEEFNKIAAYLVEHV